MEKSIVEQFVKEVPDLIQLCVCHLLDKDLQIENTKREEFIKNLYKDEYRKLNKYDFRSMFDELSNTPMPANEKGRELKAQKLLSSFRVYSEDISENETIRRIVKDVLDNPTAYPSDSVETIFYNACLVVFKFAGMLQVFFALYQLDFKHLQESCGVYLRDSSSVPTVDEVAEFVGDTVLAENIVAEIESKMEFRLPGKLNRSFARKVFDKCIELGWMEVKDEKHLIWKGIPDVNEKPGPLSYLCFETYKELVTVKMYSKYEMPDGLWKELNDLFGVNRLNDHYSGAMRAKPQRWRAPVDELIESVKNNNRV